MAEYRVNLDIYNGPLDLLLYLIRREEVDISDIPISRITRQYIEYVNVLQQLDPNLAGEFLVFAATLMEIKTRMLLPEPPPEEGGGDVLELDPRAELVRQLLEYKAFKDAAGDLHEAAIQQALKFPRNPGRIEGLDEPDKDLEDVQIWDLFDAFTKIMEAIGRTPKQHEVIYDDTPVELHAADIMDRLYREGPLTFEQVFEGRTRRIELVGLFIATLELVRQKKVLVTQEVDFGVIRIELNPNPPPDAIDDNIIKDAPQGQAEPDNSGIPSNSGIPARDSSDLADDSDPARDSSAHPADDAGSETDDALAGIDDELGLIDPDLGTYVSDAPPDDPPDQGDAGQPEGGDPARS